MKIQFLRRGIFIALCFLTVSVAYAAKPYDMLPPDAVIKRVNGVPIYKWKLDTEVSAFLPNAYYHANVDSSKLKELRQEALGRIINGELIYQYAKKEGIKVPAGKIRAEERKMIKSLGGQKKFDALLSKRKMSIEEFRAELTKENTIREFYEQRIKVTLNDRDLRAYYAANRKKFREPAKIHLRMIYVQRDPRMKNSADTAYKKAQEVYEKLKRGGDFAILAGEYSNAMSRVKGGDMGYLHKGVLDNPEVEKVAFGLKIGEMSPIIKTELGCFIVRVDGKQPEKLHPFEQVKESIRADLIKKRENKAMEELIASLRKQAKIH